MPYQAFNQTFRFMSETAFAVIRRYAQRNPAITFEELWAEFAGTPIGFHDLVHRASEQVVIDNPERFSHETISVSDENNVVVTNQWTSEAFADFMDYCATLGDEYRIVEI